MNSVLIFIVLTMSGTALSRTCCNSCNTKVNCVPSCQNQCSSKLCINLLVQKCCVPTECSTTKKTPKTVTTTLEPESETTETESDTEPGPEPEPEAEIERIQQSGGTKHHQSNTINLNNRLTNNNHININVHADSYVSNNITYVGGGSGGSGTTQEPDVTKIIPTEISTTSTTSTTMRTTTTTRTPDCCVVIKPCVTYGCNPYRRQCGGCYGSIVYWPANPCQRGCYKLSYWYRPVCYFGYCYNTEVDCSSCYYNFYETYDGYSRCRGCFYGY
ncbi:hypothetical protein Zmor_005363 [Zophobas morio]|uniref:Uncharacterized protein n=1 Tax=Zophobas morio TaxID=2755281 RepID=A0AA38MMG7_9CUCU|nr:hypothetical protein Zmor_005363 [Zophobas morio]